MKAERRHELQTNSLALWLRWRAPEIWQKYGNWILLGLIAVLLGFILIRNRINAPKEARRNALESLSLAANVTEELRIGARTLAEAFEAEELIKQAAARTSDPDIITQAFLARGDYFWALAHYSPRFFGTTQPAVPAPGRTRDDYLLEAEKSYNDALKAQTERRHLTALAHFGLAAIHESRASDLDRKTKYKTPADQNPHWKLAREQYQAVIKLPGALSIHTALANAQLKNIDRVAQPVYLTPPSTQPAATAPATSPVGPAGPIAPATQKTPAPPTPPATPPPPPKQ